MNFILKESTIDLISHFEGLRLSVYLDSQNIPTIGWGTTFYPTGVKVTINDPDITKEQANEYLLHHLNNFVLPCMNNYIKVEQNQNQIDSICSLIYNIGVNAFIHSHVLLGINNKSSISTLQDYWMMWVKPVVLTSRRKAEFQNYITPC